MVEPGVSVPVNAAGFADRRATPGLPRLLLTKGVAWRRRVRLMGTYAHLARDFLQKYALSSGWKHCQCFRHQHVYFGRLPTMLRNMTLAAGAFAVAALFGVMLHRLHRALR